LSDSVLLDLREAKKIRRRNVDRPRHQERHVRLPEVVSRGEQSRAVQAQGRAAENSRGVLSRLDRAKETALCAPGHYDYTRQFRCYILPKFEDTPIVEVTLPVLEAFRSYLNQEMGLSLKSCRNIIDGTFRAMMRDARKHGIGEKDHFADLEWPR
jgi:hypothetical protein